MTELQRSQGWTVDASRHSSAPANFGELAWRGTALYPDKVVIEQDELRITYRELEERTQRFASALQGLGVGRADRVLLMLPNDYRFVECFLGTMRAGAVAVPINIKLGAETLAYITEHSDATIAITHRDLEEKVTEVQARTARLRHVVTIGADGVGGLDYDALIAQAQLPFATTRVAESDLAVLMYTSGSTGRPKGCMRAHASEWWQARSKTRTMLFDDRAKALVVGPLYHANAMWACLYPMLFCGGSLAILPRFDPVEVLQAIERYRPTYTSGTPSMYSLLVSQREPLEHLDLSSIEVLKCGSAPVQQDLLAVLQDWFHCEVVEGYGLTEGGAVVTSPRWGPKRLGTAGIAVPGVAITIRAPEDPDRECDVGVVGELWTRSPANALGYLKDPLGTAEKFDGAGWLHTGDLVSRDADGFVAIRGRIDDLINCGGENIYPKEVEAILLSHSEIDDVCVVAARHSVKGEVPVAWVVSSSATLTEEEVKDHFFRRGPAYAHPRRVFFLDRLPVSGTSKVDRAQLAEETRRRLRDGLVPSGLAS